MSEKAHIVAEPGKTDIIITRWFDAPARLVWEACSKPELVRRWWGPRDQEMVSCEIDFRVGGGWRFVLRGRDGNSVAFRGAYKEIVPHTRVVDTFVYEPIPGAEAQQVSTLEEHAGRTKLTVRLVHTSVAARDGMVQSGMEAGMNETHARLDELLATMTSREAAAAPTAAGRRSS